MAYMTARSNQRVTQLAMEQVAQRRSSAQRALLLRGANRPAERGERLVRHARRYVC